jgi:hypothetical protein
LLRGIFGSKRDGVTGEWRRLHDEELNDLYSSPNIIRVIKTRRLRWAGHVARMGVGRGAYRILVGRPERNKPLGRRRRRWENIIKMDLTRNRLGQHGLDSSGSERGQVACSCEHSNELLGCMKFGEFIE